MRQLFLLLILFCLASPLSAEDLPPQDITLPIVEVAVAPGSAIVTREGTVTLPAGKHRLRLVDMPTSIVPQSLQVEVDSSVIVERSKLTMIPIRTVTPEDLKSLRKLYAEALARQADLKDRKRVYLGELELLQNLTLRPQEAKPDAQAPKSTLSTAHPSEWLQRIKQVGDRVARLRSILVEVQQDLKRVDATIAELEAQQEELAKTDTLAHIAAEILLRSEAGGEIPLRIRYRVGNVSWYPAYDFRADRSGRTVGLHRQALLAQNTGEDWTGVRLQFQTLPPEQTIEPPRLSVWRIGTDTSEAAVESVNFGNNRPQKETFSSLAPIPATQLQMRIQQEQLARANEDANPYDYADPFLSDMNSPALMGIGAKGGAGGRGGRFGSRSGRGRGRNLRRGGGTGTQDSMDLGLKYLASKQRADGSWNDTGQERYTTSITSMALLSFLGAGNSTKFGKYKENVRRAAAYLFKSVKPDGQIGSSLLDQALATTALAETYGMSENSAYLRPSQLALSALDRMLRPRIHLLIPDLHGTDYPRGVENLAFCAMAYKSCKVAGIPTPPSLIESLRLLAEQIESSQAMTPRIAASVGLTRSFLGQSRESLTPYLNMLMTRMPAWRPGEMHLGYTFLGSLLCFDAGTRSRYWSKWNPAMKRSVLSTQSKKGWDPKGIWFGPIKSRVGTTATVALLLQIYYRYSPVRSSARSDYADSGAGGEDEGWIPVSPMVAAEGRLYRFPADGLRSVRSDGTYHRVPIDMRSVTGTPEHVATPVIYQGVFLQSKVPNPYDAPLLDGVGRIFLENELIGETRVVGVHAGKDLVIPLGEDPRVVVKRTINQTVRPAKDSDRLRILTVALGITVTNQRKDPITIRLRDRLARSRDTRVRVRNTALTGGETHSVDTDGLATWIGTVAPSASLTVSGRYEVEYPGNIVPQAYASSDVPVEIPEDTESTENVDDKNSFDSGW